MQPSTDLLASAKSASSPPDLVWITRRRVVESNPLRGFVVGTSPTFLLLHVLSNRLDLDGYEALRMADVTSIDQEFDRKSLFLDALRLKGLSPMPLGGIDLTDARSVLRSGQERFELVVIHREIVAPDECEIGRIKLASDTTYAMKWISPNGTWEDDGTKYRYSDITRVGFDGEYENTLLMVARERNKHKNPW